MADNGGGWNAPKLLRLIKAYYASTRMTVRASGDDSLSFEIYPGVRHSTILSVGFLVKPYNATQRFSCYERPCI